MNTNENFSQKRRIPPPPPPRPMNLQRPVPRVENTQESKPAMTQQVQTSVSPTVATQNTTNAPQQVQAVKAEVVQPKPVAVKPVKVKAKKEREPLSDQSKTILFGLLGAFCLIAGIILIALMFII